MSNGWGELLRGRNGRSCAVVGGGMIIHAVNVFIATTTLPSIVHDIGGLNFFAWSTTLYVAASLLGGANCARLIRTRGVRTSYRVALACFALGCLLCAIAPTMAALLLGRFVQGLGAGTLSALSFAMVRVLFPAHLWSRAFSIVSLAWGIATLGGPAIGGIFAQYGAWRAAFWSLLALAPCLLALVELSLPRNLAREAPTAQPAPLTSLALLVASTLAISAGSMSEQPVLNAAGLAAALACFALFVRREATHAARVLPTGACNPRSPLGGVYLAMILLLLGVSSEIFVPYFLQTLHGQTPLHAGYLSALMSGGWSAGAVAGSGSRHVRLLLRTGPLVMAAGLLTLLALMPQPATGPVILTAMGAGLAAVGLGMGMCWPHLSAAVLTRAREDERTLAGASITTVTMSGNAFGSALGGMITNTTGLAATPGHAATALFALAALAPIAAAILVRRSRP